MDKRTVIINRDDCWVRTSSDMNWYRAYESSLIHKERPNHSPENRKDSLKSIFEKIRINQFFK